MRSMRTKRYILVTPAKNEEETLPLLAKSVINQSIKPSLWVIVNDNSVDKTETIIRELSKKHSWIIGHNLKDKVFEYDPTYRYSVVVREGFRVARKIAHEVGVPYGFIGLVDADFILERRFFEKILNEFQNDSQLGIASGGVYVLSGKKLVWERTNPKFARGSPRVFRRECFNDIGGYKRFYSPDVLSNYMARIKGWNVGQVVNAIAVQMRPTQGRYGYYKSSIKRGYVNYYLGTPLSSILLWVLYMGIFDSLAKASGFLRGYLEKVEKKENKLDNRWIVEFVKKDMNVVNNIQKILQMAKI